MKNLENREGYKNRHVHGLPDKATEMKIVTKDVDGENIYFCEWFPADKHNQHHEGFLGTARVISGQYKGIGFHAWEQNNSEFVYYQLV
jgi:hypothetical protein